MTLDELQKRCDEAADDAIGESRTLHLCLGLLQYFPRLLAVAKAAKALRQELEGRNLPILDDIDAALAALEAT